MKEEFVVVERKKDYHSIPELRKLLKDYDNPFFDEVRNFLKEHDIDDFSIEICILMLLDFLLNGYYLDEITYDDMWDWVERHYDLNGRYFIRKIEILPVFLRGLFGDDGFYIRYNVGTEITTITSGYIPFTSSKEIKVKDVKSYKITSREIVITCWDGRCISKKINPIMNFHLIGILIGGKSYYQRSNTAVHDGKNYVDYFDFSFNGYCGTKCNELFKNRVLNNRNIMFVYYDWLSNYIDHDFKKSGSSKISTRTTKGYVGKTISLKDNFDPTRTKPQTCTMCGKRMPINSYKAMLSMVINRLYDIDKKILEDLANSDYRPLGSKKAYITKNVILLTRADKIDKSDIYYEINLSASSILKFIRDLFDKYSLDYSELEFTIV